VNPLESAKRLVKQNVDLMMRMLKEKLENKQDNVYVNVSKNVIEGEEDKNQLETSTVRDKNNHLIEGSFN
jgi:hypothetical protein